MGYDVWPQVCGSFGPEARGAPSSRPIPGEATGATSWIGFKVSEADWHVNSTGSLSTRTGFYSSACHAGV